MQLLLGTAFFQPCFWNYPQFLFSNWGNAAFPNSSCSGLIFREANDNFLKLVSGIARGESLVDCASLTIQPVAKESGKSQQFMSITREKQENINHSVAPAMKKVVA